MRRADARAEPGRAGRAPHAARAAQRNTRVPLCYPAGRSPPQPAQMRVRSPPYARHLVRLRFLHRAHDEGLISTAELRRYKTIILDSTAHLGSSRQETDLTPTLRCDDARRTRGGGRAASNGRADLEAAVAELIRAISRALDRHCDEPRATPPGHIDPAEDLTLGRPADADAGADKCATTAAADGGGMSATAPSASEPELFLAHAAASPTDRANFAFDRKGAKTGTRDDEAGDGHDSGDALRGLDPIQVNLQRLWAAEASRAADSNIEAPRPAPAQPVAAPTARSPRRKLAAGSDGAAAPPQRANDVPVVFAPC